MNFISKAKLVSPAFTWGFFSGWNATCPNFLGWCFHTVPCSLITQLMGVLGPSPLSWSKGEISMGKLCLQPIQGRTGGTKLCSPSLQFSLLCWLWRGKGEGSSQGKHSCCLGTTVWMLPRSKECMKSGDTIGWCNEGQVDPAHLHPTWCCFYTVGRSVFMFCPHKETACIIISIWWSVAMENT